MKKRYSHHLLILILIPVVLYLTSGCAPVRGRPAPHAKKERVTTTAPSKKKHETAKVRAIPKGRETERTHESAKTPETNDPRMVASLSLTSQGEGCLRDGRYDEAINLLERSLSINSDNGKSYFFLAEAWLKKGNVSQAREFNRLAERHLRSDSAFSKRIFNQKKKIDTYDVTSK